MNMNDKKRPLTSPLVYRNNKNNHKLLIDKRYTSNNIPVANNNNNNNNNNETNNIKQRRYTTFHDSSYYKYNIHHLKQKSNISSNELRRLPLPPTSTNTHNSSSNSRNSNRSSRVNQYHHHYHQKRPKSRGYTDFRSIPESMKTMQYELNQQIEKYVRTKSNSETLHEWIHIIESEGKTYNNFFNQIVNDYEMPVNREKAFLWIQLGNHWNNLVNELLTKLKSMTKLNEQQDSVHNYTLNDVQKLRSRLQQCDIEIDTLSSSLGRRMREITDLKNELDVVKRESELEQIRVNELLNVYKKQKTTLTKETTELRHQCDTVVAANQILKANEKLFEKEKSDIIDQYENEISILKGNQEVLENEVSVQTDEITALASELKMYRQKEADENKKSFNDANIQTYSTDLYSTESQTGVVWLGRDPYIVVKTVNEKKSIINESTQTINDELMNINTLFNEGHSADNSEMNNSLKINIINDEVSDNNCKNEDNVEHDLARLDAYIQQSRRMSSSIAKHHSNLVSTKASNKSDNVVLPYSLKKSHEFIVKNVLNAYYYSTLNENSKGRCQAAALVAKDITRTKLYEIARHRVHSLTWVMTFIRSIVRQCYKFKIYNGYTLHEWVLSWLSFEYGITELLKQRTAELIISIVTQQDRCTDVRLFAEYLLYPNNHPKGEEELYIQIYGLSDQVGRRTELETLKLKIDKAYFVLQQMCEQYIKDDRAFDELKLKINGLDEVQISELFHIVREVWYNENLKQQQEERFEEIWFTIDQDNDGWINVEEFISMLSNVKPPINESDANNIYNNLSLLHGGTPRLSKAMTKNLCINMMENGSLFLRNNSGIDEYLIQWWTINDDLFSNIMKETLSDIDVLSVLRAKIRLILTHQDIETSDDLHKMCNMFASKMTETLISHIYTNIDNDMNEVWLNTLVKIIRNLVEFNTFNDNK